MTRLLFILLVGFITDKPAVIVKYSNINHNKAHIAYNRSNKLKWTDFKVDNKKRAEAALTSTEISYTINNIDDVMQIDVTCKFDKNNSILVKGNKNDYILNHEQRHFDISYLFAMKFIRTLQNEPNLTIDKVGVIYDNIYNEWDAYQDKYDKETSNSVSKANQALWDKKIDQQLDNL